MTRPSILVLGVDYAPDEIGIAPYTTGLAEHLVARGHAVTVTTTFPHYPEYRWKHAGRHRFAVDMLNGVTVRRLWTLLPSHQTAMRRIAFDSSMGAAGLLGSIGIARPDIVVSISPPVQLALAGGALARLWRAAHVVLIKDLPLDAAVAVGMMTDGLMLRLGYTLERLAYKTADRIVVISRRFNASLARHGIYGDAIAVIPDWANFPLTALSHSSDAMQDELGSGGKDLLIIHAGNMGKKQGLDPVLDAAAELTSEPVRFLMIGDGSEAPRLRDRAAQMMLKNIEFLPLQPAEDFTRILNGADILLLNQLPGVVDSVVPSKLLTYMSVGKPVLAAVSETSAAAHLVEEAACGVVVAPGNSRKLNEAILRLAASPQTRRNLGEAGKAYILENFARESVLKRWELLLDDLRA